VGAALAATIAAKAAPTHAGTKPALHRQ